MYEKKTIKGKGSKTGYRILLISRRKNREKLLLNLGHSDNLKKHGRILYKNIKIVLSR